MEGGSEDNSIGMQAAEAVSELERMHKLHEDKMSKIEELKGKKEAMMLQFQKKRKENPHKINDFEEMSGNYSSKRDRLFAEKFKDK